jgi:hypothetical protein
VNSAASNRFALIFLALVASLGGLGFAVARTVQTKAAPVDDKVAEMVLRHMMKTAEPALVKFASHFCVGVNQRDASPALLNRLKDIKPAVLPASGCQWVNGQAQAVQTGEPATFFFVRSQSCRLWRLKCTVTADYAAGNLGGHGQIYHIEKRGKAWVVTKTVEQWIS